MRIICLYIMGRIEVHLFAVLLVISEALRDRPTTVDWAGEIPTLTISGLQTTGHNHNADQCCEPVKTSLCSSDRTSSQPQVVINIKNFFCITGMREINVETEKNHIVNIALGNQEVNVAQACGAGGPQYQPNFEGPTNRDTQFVHSTYGKNVFPKNACDVLHRRVFKLPQTENDKNYEDYHLLKDFFCCRDGSVSKMASLKNHKVNAWSKTPIAAESNHGWAPDLKLFIEGKRVNDSQSHQIENPSSKNIYDTMGGSTHDGGYTGVERKYDSCYTDDFPTCINGVITFQGGFELTYDQLEEIFEEISDRPGHIKLIVPGGVTGQLLDYFQQLETSYVELALQQGVCLLSNGFLVPINPMLSVIQLHGWLSGLIPNLANESFRLLPVSMWTNSKSVLGMLRCLIKSGKMMVVFPSNKKLPFDRFEQHERHLPRTLLEKLKIELFNMSIPYDVFKNSLLDLCKNLDAS